MFCHIAIGLSLLWIQLYLRQVSLTKPTYSEGNGMTIKRIGDQQFVETSRKIEKLVTFILAYPLLVRIHPSR
jgi:hypothetical protein